MTSGTPVASLPARAPRALRRARVDDPARHYLRATLGWTLALYAVLALALTGWLAPVWLLPAVPLVYVRLALALHELMHLRGAGRVPAFHRLAMIFDTPFGLGYREHRAIHLAHHRHNAGPDDPEWFQIAGGHVRALLQAMVVPERSAWRWIARHGLSRPLARQAALRSVAFVAVAALNPPVFLAYWLVLRLSIGVSGFIFHHLLHQRDGRHGTYALPAPRWLVTLGRQVFGHEPMQILLRHREHHLWPGLRVWELPELPPAYVLPCRAAASETRLESSP
ncbi:fatty acid desaturase [Leptothrix sp. BB-4]